MKPIKLQHGLIVLPTMNASDGLDSETEKLV